MLLYCRAVMKFKLLASHSTHAWNTDTHSQTFYEEQEEADFNFTIIISVSLSMFVLEPPGLTGRLIHYSTPVRVPFLGGAHSALMAPVTSKDENPLVLQHKRIYHPGTSPQCWKRMKRMDVCTAGCQYMWQRESHRYVMRYVWADARWWHEKR